MVKNAQIVIRLPQWLREQLEELAARDNRALSNYIETKLREIAAQDHGPPPEDAEKTKRRATTRRK